MKTEEVGIVIYLSSVFTKKVDLDKLLSMAEANNKVEGTQARKRKEQVKDCFRVMSIQVCKLKVQFILFYPNN